MRLVMLKKGKLCLVFFVFLNSCIYENERKDVFKDYLINHFVSYKNLYSIINDSLKQWVDDSLIITKSSYFNPYRIDSVICFNKDSNKLLTTVNKRQTGFKDAELDEIKYLAGIKIKGKWFFFFGGSLSIPREFYQDSVYSALTFHELSWVAHKEILQNAIIQNADGTFSSNESFFDNYFDKRRWAADTCSSMESFEKLIMFREGEKYKQKLKIEEINDIKMSMKNSIRPPEPKGLWFRKLFSRKPFD